MKIASKQPQAIKSNVYVTSDTYECWYAAPRSLGKIYKRGDYWYTEDGHRHVSSRDALNYLVSHTTVQIATSISKLREIPAEKLTPPVVVRRRQAAEVAPVSQPDPVNQSHPMFQEFLEFKEFQARRKMRSLIVDNGTTK